MDETIAVVMLTIILVVGGFAAWASGFIIITQMDEEREE